MLSKTFVFSKIEKTCEKIEDSLNAFLKDHEFKYSCQNESTLKGKFIVTLFGVPKKDATIRAKVFKDQHLKELDTKVNKFLKTHNMKFATQTFVGSNVYVIVFFDTAKAGDTTPPTDANQNGTNQN